MKEIIKILVSDHEKIAEKITNIERLMRIKPEESFRLVALDLVFFKDFTFGGHHLREEEILYAWMRSQNPNADTSIMDRIKSEHTQLEKLGDKILGAINSFLKNTPDSSNITILSDLNDFITLYVEHMVKEEKFIFMIAEGLKLSKNEKETMMKKLQETLA